MAGFVLLLQALALVGSTVGLAVVWAMRGWTIERGQTLGVLWLGVMILLGFIVWIATSMSHSAERPPLYALRERSLSN
jgi:SNF family Na+-dependent transporter